MKNKTQDNSILEAASKAKKLIDNVMKQVPEPILTGGKLLAPAFAVSHPGDKLDYRDNRPTSLTYTDVRKDVMMPNIRSMGVRNIIKLLYGNKLSKQWQKALSDKGKDIVVDRESFMALIGAVVGSSLGREIRTSETKVGSYTGVKMDIMHVLETARYMFKEAVNIGYDPKLTKTQKPLTVGYDPTLTSAGPNPKLTQPGAGGAANPASVVNEPEGGNMSENKTDKDPAADAATKNKPKPGAWDWSNLFQNFATSQEPQFKALRGGVGALGGTIIGNLVGQGGLGALAGGFIGANYDPVKTKEYLSNMGVDISKHKQQEEK